MKRAPLRRGQGAGLREPLPAWAPSRPLGGATGGCYALVYGMTDFPGIIRSPLSQIITHDGITVRVEIYRLDGTEGWTLELVDEEGGSTVWQDSFATDAEAFAEFMDGVRQLGLAKLIDPDDDDIATVH